MLKYSVVFLCLFCFSCATQRGKYIQESNKTNTFLDSRKNKVEIYSKNQVEDSLKAFNSSRTVIGKDMPALNLDIRFSKPLVFSIPSLVSNVQLNKRQLLSGSFKLFLPKLESIGVSNDLAFTMEKNEELMLARVNAEIKYLKKRTPVNKSAKEKHAAPHTSESSSVPASKPANSVVKHKAKSVIKKSETTAKPYKNIISRPNDSIIISFQGLGWVYEGSNDVSAAAGGIEYKGKDYSSDKTSFTFKAHKVGIYLLKFVKQDNNTATSTNKTVKLQVVKEADFSKILTAENNTDQLENPNREIDYTVPDNLYKRDDVKEALKEYLKIYKSNDPYLNERIALLYLKEKEYEAALKYWKRNLEPANAYYREALEGTILAGAKSDDIVVVSRTIEDYKNILDKSISVKDNKILFDIAQALYQNNRTKFAIELLNTYIKNYLNGKYLDAVYFYLGDLYENDKGIRDLKKSLSFYEKVYKDYTGSAYYSMAYKRIDYIKRHFFDIR